MKSLHRTLRFSVSFACACIFTGMVVGTPCAADTVAQDSIAKWQALAPEEKEQFRQTYRLWKELAPEERQQILENYKKFKSLSQDERQRLLENYRHYQRLDPTQRKVVMERYKKWREMSPEQQELLRKRFQILLNMHPEEQARFYENYETWRRLTAEKKQELLNTWNAITPSRRSALLIKHQQTLTPERAEEIKRILKKIRKEQLDAGRDKNLLESKKSPSANK